MPAISDLSDDQWKEVETLAVAGMSYAELGEAFGVEPGTIAVRAHRKEWAVPARVQRLRKELEEKRLIQTNPTDLVGNVRECNSGVLMAENLLEIGQRNALRVAKYTEKKLQRAIETDSLPEIEDWKVAAIANSMNSKATGMDKPQTAVQVNLFSDDIRPE